jgi:Ca-activated chloride channel homolog
MTRRMAFGTILSLLVTAGTLSGQFRAGVDLVRVPVIVTARGGEPLKGLTAANFEVREDGRIQEIDYFSQGASGDALPLHLGLLLDTSGSMDRDLGDAMSASIQFVNTVDESVDVTLVQFDTTISLSRFVPASYPLLFERIRRHKADGRTALYDALAVYLEDAMSREGQHVLILYSDGGDSSSTIHISRLMDLLRLASNVIVYPIGYLENQRSTARIQQQMQLARIADESGGQAFFPGSVNEMESIYSKILQELASRYTLGYVSSNRAADGRFRKLQLKASTPETPRLAVRARSGYYGARIP